MANGEESSSPEQNGAPAPVEAEAQPTEADAQQAEADAQQALTESQQEEEKRKSEAEATYQEQYGGQDKRLVKAAMIPRDGNTTIEFMFNPTDLQFSRSVTIVDIKGARTLQGLPKVNFGFVEPYKLKLSGLVFDTFETGKDVYEIIAAIRESVDFRKFSSVSLGQRAGEVVDSAKSNFVANRGTDGKGAFNQSLAGPLALKRPPVYYFIWGKHNYITCMVESLSFKLTMFLPNGTPVRALVDLSLKEVDLTAQSLAYSG